MVFISVHSKIHSMVIVVVIICIVVLSLAMFRLRISNEKMRSQSDTFFGTVQSGMNYMCLLDMVNAN